MRIVHVLPSGGYSENAGYQDNLLVRQNILDGHDVTVISDCSKLERSVEIEVLPEDCIVEDNVHLIRLPYKNYILKQITNRIRDLKGLYPLLEKLSPDIIRVLNFPNRSLLTIAKYKKNHQNVKLYVDSHAEYPNTRVDCLIGQLFHKIYIKNIIKKIYPFIDKIFYCTEETKDILQQVYGLSSEKLEWFPLVGDVPSEQFYSASRIKRRDEYNIKDGDILLLHSGKLEREKKTIEILSALKAIKSEKIRLIIVGGIPEHMDTILKKMIAEDKRVIYVGWKTAIELKEFMCAADLYLQPGTHSVSMQNSLCCSCPIVIPNDYGYNIYFEDKGWIGGNQKELELILEDILSNPMLLKKYADNAKSFSLEYLDAKKLAKKLYSN